MISIFFLFSCFLKEGKIFPHHVETQFNDKVDFSIAMNQVQMAEPRNHHILIILIYVGHIFAYLRDGLKDNFLLQFRSSFKGRSSRDEKLFILIYSSSFDVVTDFKLGTRLFNNFLIFWSLEMISIFFLFSYLLKVEKIFPHHLET